MFSEAGWVLTETKDQRRDEMRSHYLSTPGPLLWVISISLFKRKKTTQSSFVYRGGAALQIIRKRVLSSVHENAKWCLTLCEIKIIDSVEYL